MSKPEVLILDCGVSPFCMRVKIALNEKGVKYETQEEDLFGGKSELLLTSNPIYKKVPVLLHNGKPLSESKIIVSYIDETWTSDPPLLPSSPYARAKAWFWADYIDKKLFDTGSEIWTKNGEERAVGVKNLIEVVKQLEEALGEKDFFGDNTFGFVDISAIAITSWFYVYEELGGFKLGDHCPKFSAWIKRCLRRESVAKVIPPPEKVYEFVIWFRKMQGLE